MSWINGCETVYGQLIQICEICAFRREQFTEEPISL